MQQSPLRVGAQRVSRSQLTGLRQEWARYVKKIRVPSQAQPMAPCPCESTAR